MCSPWLPTPRIRQGGVGYLGEWHRFLRQPREILGGIRTHIGFVLEKASKRLHESQDLRDKIIDLAETYKFLLPMGDCVSPLKQYDVNERAICQEVSGVNAAD
jgi:hypothetical protein